MPAQQANIAAALAVIALMVMGALALVLCFQIAPRENHDYLLILLGALAGALSMQGPGKVADKLTSSTGPDATITVAPAAKET